MGSPFIDKVHLDIEQAYIMSQRVGKAGSWLYICDTGECCWSVETYELHMIDKETVVTKETFFGDIISEDKEKAVSDFQSVYQNGIYQTVYRIQVNKKIIWLEDRGQLYADEKSGLTYIVGWVHDITWIKEQEQKNASRQYEFEVITDYLAETTNTTELYNIVKSVQNTITKVMDVTLVGIFTHIDNAFTRVIPEGTFDSKIFLTQKESEYMAYETMSTGAMKEISIGDYPNKKSMESLLELGTQTIVSMPIRNNGKIIGALSIALKGKSLKDNERSFCNTICGYLSTQLKNALLYRQLEKELEEKNRAEEKNLELQKSVEMEKLKTEFFANLSHEFKTPLNIILSSIELAKMKLGREKRELIEVSGYDKLCFYMELNAYRLLHLTTNLIDSTKLDSKFLEPVFRNHNIVEMVSNLVNSTESYATQRKIRLNFTSALLESPYITCDKDMVERIILNLLSNGIKNTKEGGNLEVTILEVEHYIKIQVSDTGCGIEEKMLPHIFDKFYVTKNGLTRPNEGSGLGLSISKALVELHQGTILAKSRIGQGAIFEFTISKYLEDNSQYALGDSHKDDICSTRIKMEYAQMD